MNTIQKLILVLSTIFAVYLLLSAPKYYHRYSPRAGHIYKDFPFDGAKQEINYSAIVPKLISLVLISATLIIITSNLRIKNFSRKEIILFILSLILIVLLSIAHFASFGERNLYLLEIYYYSSMGIILSAWLIYYIFIKRK